MAQDSDVISLLGRLPQKNENEKTNNNKFSSPFLIDNQSDSFGEEIELIRNFRDTFIVSSTQSAPIDSINMAVQRGVALISPYILTTPEQYIGQHEAFFTAFRERFKNAQFCHDEFGDLPQEAYTIIAMGSQFCQLRKTPNGTIETGLPLIDKHLTENEKAYLSDIQTAYDDTYLDAQATCALPMLYHIYEDLTDIKNLMLSGDMPNPDIQKKGQIIANLIVQYEDLPPEDTIEHEICLLLKNIETLRVKKEYHYDSEFYDLFKEDGFSEENIKVSLESLGIMPSKTNIALVLNTLEALETFPQVRSQTALEYYKDVTLAPLVKFLEYYPNADPDIVSFALVEAFLPYGQGEQQTKEEIMLAEDISQYTEEAFSQETFEKFIAWKEGKEDQWGQYPEKKEELESFCVCKNLVTMYDCIRHISLGYTRNLIIANDITQGEFLYNNIDPQLVQNKDIADELINSLGELEHSINSAFKETPQEISQMEEEIPPPENKTRLQLVTKNWTPDT